MKCLEKKPDDRYPSARMLEEALESLVFAEPWSRKKAEEWWTLHGIIGDAPKDYACFFRADSESDDALLPALVVADRTA
jgi:hypothetical protein